MNALVAKAVETCANKGVPYSDAIACGAPAGWASSSSATVFRERICRGTTSRSRQREEPRIALKLHRGVTRMLPPRLKGQLVESSREMVRKDRSVKYSDPKATAEPRPPAPACVKGLAGSHAWNRRSGDDDAAPARGAGSCGRWWRPFATSRSTRPARGATSRSASTSDGPCATDSFCRRHAARATSEATSCWCSRERSSPSPATVAPSQGSAGTSSTPTARDYLVHLYERRSVFPGGAERTIPRAARRIARAARRRCSTTGTGCTASTITSRRTPSISPRKPRRSSPCVPSCGGWIRAGSASSSSAAASWRTGRCSTDIHVLPGALGWVFATAAARAEGRVLPAPRSGRSRPVLEPEAYYAGAPRRLLAEPAALLRRRGARSGCR